MKNYINKPDILKWYIFKILLIMRLTTVILMVSMLQVSASTVAQEFNYVKKGVSLIQIFKEIKKQTGYNIIWNEKKIDVTARIDANFKKATIQDVLNKCLKNLSLSYSINDKMVMIKEEQPSFRKKLADFFNSIDVRGRVVGENNQPLVGATVKVKGSSISTPTNSNGEFLLKNVDESSILVISFLGYVTQEVKASVNIGSVKLALSDDRLEEVEINAGYYKVTDRERTGSISRITSKDIDKQPVNNVLQAMQANIPGVVITQNTGQPGSGFSVQIRGRNSVNLLVNNDPFYVIDGVPFNSTSLAGARDLNTTRGASPLASINPSDIESIEVLKDADATAIYGSRGANGVVLITTKRGKQGKPKTSLTFNQGISRVGKKIKLMNTDQYVMMRKEALLNDNKAISPLDYDINGTWDQSRNTDWQKELIGRNAPTTNALFSLSGGTGNITYLFGGAYFREGTVFPGESKFNRNSGNFSLQYLSNNKKLSLSFDGNYSQLNNDLLTADLTQFIRLPSNYPALRDEQGNLNWQNNTMYENPLAILERKYETKANTLVSNAYVSYEILSNLKVKATVGYTIQDRKELSKIPLTSYSPALNFGPTRRSSSFANNSSNNWNIEGQIDYFKKIGRGKLNILAGTTFQQGLYQLQETSGSGYNNDALMGNIGSASTLSGFASYRQYRYSALFGRLNYTFDEKYIINLTGRRDGSSRFGSDNRFANFGAIGAAWILSKEKLVEQLLPSIGLLKLRGSYGITGNDQIADYGYLALWSTPFGAAGTYQGVSTLAPDRIGNPNYRWEINKKAEVALEIGLFNNRLFLSSGYYVNRSSNQLVDRPLTTGTGFSGVQENLPATVENSGWEFTLNITNISSNSFIWSSSVNLTVPKNELIAYPDLSTSSYASSYIIGQPLSIRKLYHTSLNPQTGIYVTEDYDKNGIVELDKDQYLTQFVGRKYYGGIQNSFSYKGIGLDFLFQFVKQLGRSYLADFSSPGSFSATSPIGNQPVEVLDRWRNIGDLTEFQKYGTNTTIFNNVKVRGHLAFEDTSFIRLKNLGLSYNLRPISSKMKIENAKLFIQGQNLFTITKYKGLDPETQSLTGLPSLQIFTVGIKLTL